MRIHKSSPNYLTRLWLDPNEEDILESRDVFSLKPHGI